MAKKQKEQTTTITLTMEQYNELEGVIANAHFGGYYYRLKEEQPQDVKHTKSCMIRFVLQILSIIGGANAKIYQRIHKGSNRIHQRVYFISL